MTIPIKDLADGSLDFSVDEKEDEDDRFVVLKYKGVTLATFICPLTMNVSLIKIRDVIKGFTRGLEYAENNGWTRV